MTSWLVNYGFQYACYILEAGLIVFVVCSSYFRRPVSAAFYLACLLAAGVARSFALSRYGFNSAQYQYVYWTTDFLLVISAFFLVCLFFRRACFHQEKMWRYVRLLLTFVCLLVVGISGFSFSHHYKNLFTRFLVDFNQNLYFACLVLNTLLYILLQQIESTDDQLGLLVCGVGIQFAGPTASLALLHLTASESYAKLLTVLVVRLCALGMLLVWAYAIVHVKDKATQVARREIPVLAEAAAHFNIHI
jgi:hypothetical protein